MSNPHQLTFSQIVEGYSLYAAARHLSPNTIAEYANTYRQFTAWCVKTGAPDPVFLSITPEVINKFLASLTVSNKTIKNYHIGLSALWTWALSERLAPENILRQVPVAKPEKAQIVPFSYSDVSALMRAVERTRAYARAGKTESDHALANPPRTTAILLTMLDTGVRATELCDATIANVDTKNNRIEVFGKGSKHRTVPFSPRTGQALWRYLATRPAAHLNEPLFPTDTGRHMDRFGLGDLLDRLAARAGVVDCHAHRFRHTFAITYLRNGGDPFTLQALLGHERMDTVKIYLSIAMSDIDAAHKRASPVANWRL